MDTAVPDRLQALRGSGASPGPSPSPDPSPSSHGCKSHDCVQVHVKTHNLGTGCVMTGRGVTCGVSFSATMELVTLEDLTAVYEKHTSMYSKGWNAHLSQLAGGG